MRIIKYSVNTSLEFSYRLAIIADLHGKTKEYIINQIREFGVNMICIPGDLVDGAIKDNLDIIDFLKKCVEISDTYFSLGNHDFTLSQSDLEMIKETGVFVLNDGWEYYNNEIIIGGLTSAFYHKCEKYSPKDKKVAVSNIKWLEEFSKQKKYKILLDHHPENYDLYTKNMDIDLILSGHNHGGQIRLFRHGVYARNQGIFPKYDGGIFDNKLVVSRGLSNNVLIPRLFNPEELVFIELDNKK